MLTILFDVGHVIIKSDHTITYKILKDHGVSEKNAKTFFTNKAYKDFSRGKINGKQFYQSLVDDYLQTPLSYEQVVNAHHKHIFALDKGVSRILSQLASKKLVFLTDTNAWQTEREKELVDLSIFSKTIFRSHEIHRLKTDPGCFPYIIKQLHCKPEQILLIDDNIKNIHLAQKHGLQTLHFIDAKQLREALKKKGLL